MIVNLEQLRLQATARSAFPEFQDGDPRKLVTFSLEQQKKRAKDLLRAVGNGEANALRRYRKVVPQSSEAIQLSDVQFVIARENGFKKWTDFKSYIDQATLEAKSIAAENPTALDAGKRTLHIRCGHDIMHKLAMAGFVGDFLPFPDPYVMGPVPKTTNLEEFIAIRAQYLSRWTGSTESAQSRLTDEYAALRQAQNYDRVVIWCEHDSYDQLILARLLDFFQDRTNRPAEIKLIAISDFPGVEIFNGLGQLPPEALRLLWGQSFTITDAQLQLGIQVWDAVTDTTPCALFNLVESGTPLLPLMAPALQRHLRELPSTENGLSLTEQLILQILSEKGTMNAARLFGWYTNHYEPLTFLGDMMFYDVLEQLAKATSPAVQIQRSSSKPTEWIVSLSDIGNQLLQNRCDWIEINHIDRWLGGMHIISGRQSWRIGSDLEPMLQ